jgi:hypothetical protein
MTQELYTAERPAKQLSASAIAVALRRLFYLERDDADAKPATGLMKRLTIDIPARLHRRLDLACIKADRTMAAEVLALIERHITEVETATAMERFTAVADTRGMVISDLLEHALDAFVREQEGSGKTDDRPGT